MQTGSLGSLGSKVRYRRRTSDEEPPRRRRTSTESGAPHEVARLSDVKEDEVGTFSEPGKEFGESTGMRSPGEQEEKGEKGHQRVVRLSDVKEDKVGTWPDTGGELGDTKGQQRAEDTREVREVKERKKVASEACMRLWGSFGGPV